MNRQGTQIEKCNVLINRSLDLAQASAEQGTQIEECKHFCADGRRKKKPGGAQVAFSRNLIIYNNHIQKLLKCFVDFFVVRKFIW